MIYMSTIPHIQESIPVYQDWEWELFDAEDNPKRGNALSILNTRVPSIRNMRESSSGREAYGIIDCKCGATNCQVTCCSDVGGVWIHCPKCGLIDV